MDFLNKAYGQAKDLLLSMTPATRLVTGLLAALVVVSLVYLFQPTDSGDDEYLLGGRSFSTDELIDVQRALSEAGLQGYQLDGTRIKIPRGKRAEYIAAMATGKAVPANFNEYMDEALATSHPFESRDKQQARLKQAKQKELSLILRAMEGIERATVQYDVAQTSGFPRRQVATAMVAVRPATGWELDSARVTSIQDLVASSIAGMKRENVTVNDLVAGITWAGVAMTGDAGRGAIYANMKRQYERDWAEKVRKALAFVPGAVVAANVELGPQFKHTEMSSKLAPEELTTRGTEHAKTHASNTLLPSGLRGSEPNSIMSGGAISCDDARTESMESSSEAPQITGSDETYSVKAPLLPQRVTVSVSLPSDYYVDVWKQRNPAVDGTPGPAPTATDLQRIEEGVKTTVRDTVVGLLPVVSPEEDPYEQVKVTSYQSLAAAEPPDPAISEQAIGWLSNNWSVLGMIGVGLCGVLMLRGMVRSRAPTAASAGRQRLPMTVAGRDDRAESDQNEKQPLRVHGPSFRPAGPKLEGELTEMIRENPDNAAAILKNWIGKSA